MRLKHIDVFNAVMLTGTVSSAARLLNVSQPAVTQALHHAELQLGYPLFTRQRNRLVPTREAHALYPEVQRLMTQIEGVRRLATALREGDDQTFRILIVPSLAVKALPDALERFRKRYAATRISIRTMHSAEIAKAVALQEADVGIVFGRVPHPAVDDENVANGRLVYVHKASAPAAGGQAVSLPEVLKKPLVCIDERDPVGALLADNLQRLNLSPIGGITVQTNHIAMVLCERGFGAAIIDSFTAQARRDKTLVVRPLTPDILVEVRALIPKAMRSHEMTETFVAAMRHATAGGAEAA